MTIPMKMILIHRDGAGAMELMTEFYSDDVELSAQATADYAMCRVQICEKKRHNGNIK